MLLVFILEYFIFVKVDNLLQKTSSGSGESDQKNMSSMRSQVILVTDGQLPLRQCLLPETCTKNISEPPAVFCCFYDIRKELRKCFPLLPEVNSVQDMVTCKLTFIYYKLAYQRNEGILYL